MVVMRLGGFDAQVSVVGSQGESREWLEERRVERYLGGPQGAFVGDGALVSV